MKKENQDIVIEGYYNKALYYFSLGLLDEALNFYMKAISEGCNYPEAINTAALILMYKGEFNKAYRLFNMNAKLNKDKEAQKYLAGFDGINQHIDNYNRAIDYIKENRYEEAIKIYEAESKEGFRTQDGDITLCVLYYLQSKYKKSLEVLQNIHDMDKGCLFYIKMKKALDVKKRKHKIASYAAAATIICLFGITAFMGYKLNQKPKEVVKYHVKYQVKTVEKEKRVQVIKRIPVTIRDNNAQLLTNLIITASRKDYYNFERYKNLISYKSLSYQNKKIYKNLYKNFKAAAPEYFYNEGKAYYKQSRYKKCYECMSLAARYSNGDHDEYILYKLALSGQRIKAPNTLKHFEKYVQQYRNGVYIDEMLNRLATIYYNNKKLNEAMYYAKKIDPSSEYFTSQMKTIIGAEKKNNG